MPEFSEGILGDGAAILMDGKPLTIRQIINRLEQGDRARHALTALEHVKIRQTQLRVELKDALCMAYGAPCNWPESAVALLGDDKESVSASD